MLTDALQTNAHAAAESELNARLDRLPLWPHSPLIILVIGIGYLFTFVCISNIGFGLPVFSKALHFTPEQRALPITTGLLGYVFGSLLVSNLADTIGRRPGIATAISLVTVGGISTAFASGVISMSVGRFITGMGIGSEIAVVAAYIGEMAPASVRGRYTSVVHIFAMIGQSAVPFLALATIPNYTWGWRALLVVGALGGITLAAFPWIPESPRWLLNRNRIDEARLIIEAAEARVRKWSRQPLAPISQANSEPRSVRPSLSALLRPPLIGQITLLFSLWFIWYVGLYTWLGLGPTFFVDRGYSLTHTITFLIASSFGFPLGAILAATIGDMLERNRMILGGMVVSAACYAALGTLYSHPLLVYTFVFILSTSLGFYLPLMYALGAESFPTSTRVTGLSLSAGLGHLGGAVGPLLAGFVYSHDWIGSGFLTVFLFMAFTTLLGAMLLPFTTKATRTPLAAITRRA